MELVIGRRRWEKEVLAKNDYLRQGHLPMGDRRIYWVDYLTNTGQVIPGKFGKFYLLGRA